jgi:glycosidase
MNAQISLSIEKPVLNEEVILTFDATKGNRELADYEGNIYAHTGILTNQSTHGGDWKHVVAGWEENRPELKLKKVGDSIYELRFKIAELYGIPVTGGNVVALTYVFRSEDGRKIGRAKGGGDIYHYFKKPNFKEIPKAKEFSKTPEPEWAKYASVYEVNIRQYTKEGTFKAFAEHLPRLRDMGVDILWIMPIQPIGKVKRKGTLGSYYSIQDYKGINPEFGTLKDFIKLVNQCHGMGFKVILDWVANHSAWDNVWMETNPEWYVRNEKGEVLAPYDWTDVADLNFDQHHLRVAMKDAMLFWIKDIGLDGFRCDVAGEVPLDFWEDVREELNEIKPVWMLAENADQLYLMNKAFNSNYGWPFHHLMNEMAKGHRNPNEIFGYIQNVESNYPKGAYPINFTTNHDENSWQGTVFERLGKSHKVFAALTFVMPGIPLIYSGQEAGLNKRLEFFEKDEIDWTDESLMPFYKQLNQLKANNPALWNGFAGGDLKQIGVNGSDAVVAFSREKDGNQVIFMANFSNNPHKVTFRFTNNLGSQSEYFSGKTHKLIDENIMSFEPWEFRVFVN